MEFCLIVMVDVTGTNTGVGHYVLVTVPKQLKCNLVPVTVPKS